MNKSPRAVARDAGLKSYEGLPCKKCGGTVRRTVSGNCSACLSSYVIKWKNTSGWNQKYKEREKERAKVYREENRDRLNAYRREWAKKRRAEQPSI